MPRKRFIIFALLSYLILSLCACANNTSSVENPPETTTETPAESEPETSATESDAVGSKHSLQMDNGDVLQITFREGWESSNSSPYALSVELPGKYAAVYSDSGIKVGETGSIESRMRDSFNVDMQNSGTIDIDGKECYAGFTDMDNEGKHIYMFQDVGLTDYVLIDIKDQTGGAVEIAMSEFAIY